MDKKQNTKLSVAIVDDHFAVRDGYRSFMNKIEYVEQVHTFDNGKELLVEMKKKPFDLILLDIELKNENGIDLCIRIKNLYKNVKVLIISSYHSEEYITEAYQNNAEGYLFKDAESKEVRKAIDKIIMDDNKYFNTEAVEVIFNKQEFYKKRANKQEKELTEREMQVEKLICQGHSNKEIANLLGRTKTTVTTHRQNIMKKINAHNSIDIINHAIKGGIYTPSQKSSIK